MVNKIEGKYDFGCTRYNSGINGQVKPLYNGNISETFWRTATDNVRRKYGYSYDHQNRLKAAYFQLPGTVSPHDGSFNTAYSYDDNGNILSLERYEGSSSPAVPPIEIDDLGYTYDNGNKLLKVADATAYPSGFNTNGAGTNAQYTYDSFGNLKSDPYKKITNITYNHLNLPVKITFGGGETIAYTYLADGRKIKKNVQDSQSNTTATVYSEGFQYKNESLEFFPHSEGYVKTTPMVNGYYYSYIYTHTDHLGNIRIKYTKHPQTGELKILEENHYYPYGLTHNGYNGAHLVVGLEQPGTEITLIEVTPDVTDTHKYKFNGQEYNQNFGLNVTEMDFRMYDNALGRFNVMDEMSELAYDVTPYRFGFNNPIYFSDPTGLWEEVEGGYTTNDQDEIARFVGYLKYNEDADKDHAGMMNFIKEDIAFFESFDKGLRLSTAYVRNGKITDHSVHRMKNEIAYYQGYTDYLYTREDYEMRNIILADGGKDPISRVLLGWEQSGNYQPITASNYISYVGSEKTARLLTVQSFMGMMGSVNGGPSSVSRSVTPRYLGTRTNQGSLAARNKISSGIGTSTSTVISPKDMNWQQFRQQYSHLYRGQFRGRGTYMRFMAMDYNAMKAGLRD